MGAADVSSDLTDLDEVLESLRDRLAAGAEGRARREDRAAPPHTNPLVSVIVLNFNGADLLPRCIESLYAQSYTNFEIIVVDNASADESLEVLAGYLPSEKLTVVRSETNRGVPGGRNLGVLHARGEIVAFIDNDGYARPGWLDHLVRRFDDETVGAVASLVFFARKKIVVNGAGGTLNHAGYGGDHGFCRSVEFVDLPGEVLYPMGCGMALRRKLLGQVFPLDDRIFNYYDDVELGIRVWNAGARVVLAPGAWIDHEFSTSDAINQNKMYLCERNRIRTMLKFSPYRHLPRWFLNEWALRRYFGIAGMRSLPLRAWLWNLLHLPSALLARVRLSPRAERYWGRTAPTWKQYPPPLPAEHRNTAELAQAGSGVDLGAEESTKQLLFGWFWVDSQAGESFRWGASEASLLLRAEPDARHLALRFRVADGEQRIRLIVRKLGNLESVLEFDLPRGRPHSWREEKVPFAGTSGIYECLFISEIGFVDATGRQLGPGLSRIGFEMG